MTVSSPPLRIALVVFRLAPAGGLEQHALRLADLLARRGHGVTMLTTRAPVGGAASGVEVEVLPARGRSNHGRLAAFAEDAARAAANRFDRTVAFHAVPGFDVVFCADPSRARPGPLKALSPRYRTYARLERAAFAPPSRTLVLCLAAAQRDAFVRNNRAPPDRLVLLPPTVERIATDPDARTPGARGAARADLAIAAPAPVWLWMGLQPKTKGLDRALAALASEPQARLIVTGLDPASRSGRAARDLAQRLRVSERVTWLGFASRERLGGAQAAADLLLHPARDDVTGTVILEAMARGLPVVATEVCGYAEHVRRADAGVVLAEPFRAADLRRALADASPAQLAGWSANALAYMRQDGLFTGLDRAADAIEAAPRVA